MKIPEGAADANGLGIELCAFDRFIHTGRDSQMTHPGRANRLRTNRLIAAVEYLQGQRAREMRMAKLAGEATDAAADAPRPALRL